MAGAIKTKYGMMCSQKWEDLTIKSSCTSHCNQCKKDVVDFTSWERKDIVDLYKVNPNTCGYFKLEQIDPPLFEFNLPTAPKYLKAAVAASILISSSVLGQNNDTSSLKKVEQIDNPNVKVDSVVPLNCKSPSASVEVNLVSDVEPVQKKRKYYLSKRFPFIHKRRTNILLGCPAF